MAQVVVSERVIECRSDACSLWNLLTDTDRTNRAVGMARLDLSPLRDATAARSVRKGAAHTDALTRALRALEATVAPELAQRLAGHVRDADDADVARLRPFELADAWGAPRREVLAACLRAVPAGLLELRWEI